MNPRSFLIRPFAVTPQVLTAVLLAGFAVPETLAQPQPDNSAVISIYVGPTPQPSPAPRETGDYGPSLGPSGRPISGDFLYPSPYPDKTFRRPFGPFFLPPLLPVLGADRSASSTSLAAHYPREFVGEPFFMAYGNLAANHQLSAKRAARIDRYRMARLNLLTELRELLIREQDGSALAAVQTPRLLELEAEAEQIRRDLTRVELFSTPADDIGKLVPIKDHPNDVLGAVRLTLSAAHFRDGFSSDQRRLLEEMAMETQLVIQPEPEVPGPAPVFFWPAGVRIASPADLSPAAAAQFAEFQRRKAVLKDELHDALERDRKQLFNLDNTETFTRLAARQAPRFAELDALADQLRPALAAALPSARNAGEHQYPGSVYAAAVLTPGLSAPQRRLLLAAAALDSLQ